MQRKNFKESKHMLYEISFKFLQTKVSKTPEYTNLHVY